MSFSVELDLDELHPSQRDFFEDRSPYCLMAGGYGSGKTTALALKILQLAAENYPYPGLVMGPTMALVKTVLLRTLRRILLTGMSYSEVSRLMRVHDPMHERYLLWGDCRIYIRSGVNAGSAEGLEVAWFAADEIRLITKDAYDVGISRVRVKEAPRLQRVFASTPEMGWMADEFDRKKDGHRLIVAPTRENVANLPEDYIDNLRLSYSRPKQRAVLEGQFVTLHGGVYDQFDPSRDSPWRVEYDFRWLRQQQTYMFIDPGYRRPAFLWARRVGHPGDLRWVIFHQWMPDNMAMAESVIAINNWNERNNVSIDEVWVDPAADATEQAVAIDVMDALAGLQMRGRGGVQYCTGIYRSVSFGVDKVRTSLGDPDYDQPIRVQFADRVYDLESKTNRGIIRSLSGYRYAKERDGRALSDRPLKDGLYEHACDALRYGIVGLWLSTELRELDSFLRASQSQGYERRAA